MKPPKRNSADSLYEPDRARTQIRRAMGPAVDLLNQEIRFGCRLLQDAPSFTADSNRYAARHLYRSLLGALDGVDTLLLSGSGDEARVLLRKAVELTAQLHYLAVRKDDFLLGTAFMIELFFEMSAAYGTKIERAEWPRIFHQAEREMQKVKAKAGKRTVRWYAIHGGPRGIRQLVQATQHGVLVEMWEDLSKSVHASITMEAVERRIPELERKLAAGGLDGLTLGPLRTSAQVQWKKILFDADILWVVGTMATLFWEDQLIESVFTFNRRTRLPRLKRITNEGLEEVDLLCILEREGRPLEPPHPSS
jgi:hypothetical protein